jgi:glycolate oxidase
MRPRNRNRHAGLNSVTSGLIARAAAIVGDPYVRQDAASLDAYGVDGLKRGHAADLVLLPGSAREIGAIARLCNEARVPLVARGGGTGYSGGAVPVQGGVVVSLERLNRILEIDEKNLLARVEPNVITGELQSAVEQVGLFYPPDPASLRESVIGGNVAECAGGPRAFKYGTTRHYVLGLEAVLPTGEIIRTGSKAVKNVVGYDVTQLLVGSEGTLAIFTEILLRLIPKPPARATLRVIFGSVADAVSAVDGLLRARAVPAAIELVDGECLDAVAAYLKTPLAPAGSAAALVIEVDGMPGQVEEEIARVEEACRSARALEVLRARTDEEREELWRVRRELSPSLEVISPVKLNHDVVVPRGRVPALFDLIERIRREWRLRIPCFGHAGDGNIHVNIMIDAGDADARRRAQAAERAVFEGVVALEGSISGEHGIGFAKAPYLGLELSLHEIALMKRLKQAFDPSGILNPGKIFPG